jgi:signal transduction histidine kinase
VEKERFRIMQEALNNAVKHSEAELITVTLGAAKGRVLLLVEDDGRGFDTADPLLRARRLGLTSMEERAEDLGGEARITSKPGKGTKVRVEVPLAG